MIQRFKGLMLEPNCKAVIHAVIINLKLQYTSVFNPWVLRNKFVCSFVIKYKNNLHVSVSHSYNACSDLEYTDDLLTGDARVGCVRVET